MPKNDDRTIFEKSQPEQHAYSLPKEAAEFRKYAMDDQWVRKSALPLPETSEIDLTRHFAGLAKKNMGIDTNFYPLGSCTMKLNPRVNELCAQLPGFTQTHPLAPVESVQGNLELIHHLIEHLCRISGMDAGTLLPNAGAQGEFTGLQMIAAYHQSRGDLERTEVLVPDDAHGTNPATATMSGYRTLPIKTGPQGDLDIAHLKSLLSNKTAALMLTNPSTLGLFSRSIEEITRLVHEAGGLLYYDGANLNSILNIAKPGAMGFDVMHINLHKTFSTPHGGGGPGAGPVCCKEILRPYLPMPRVEKQGNAYRVVREDTNSIGAMASFHGNFAIYLRAYLYIMLHGDYGLRKIAEMAVVNANYVKKGIERFLTVPFKEPCMHEFVAQVDCFAEQGVRANDIAKRLLDYGVHAPTVYFPLIIKECLLIEPTESESKATLDRFIEIIAEIVQEIRQNPELVKNAPHSLPVTRLDEVLAAKKPVLRHATYA